MVPTTSTKAASRPRKVMTPKAKPAGTESASLPSVMAPATTTELANHVPTGWRRKAAVKLPSVAWSGHSERVARNTSCDGAKAVRSIQARGNSVTRQATTKAACRTSCPPARRAAGRAGRATGAARRPSATASVVVDMPLTEAELRPCDAGHEDGDQHRDRRRLAELEVAEAALVEEIEEVARGAVGAALGQHVDGAYDLVQHDDDRRHDGKEEGGRDQRQLDIDGLAEGARAIDARRFGNVGRHVGEGRQEDQQVEPEALPEGDGDHAPDGQVRVAEPALRRHAQRTRERVEETHGRIEQPQPHHRGDGEGKHGRREQGGAIEAPGRLG